MRGVWPSLRSRGMAEALDRLERALGGVMLAGGSCLPVGMRVKFGCGLCLRSVMWCVACGVSLRGSK